MTKKITIPSFGGDDYEDQFIEFMREVILKTNVDPESVPRMMDRCYREKFDLPMNMVYAQFLDRNFDFDGDN